MNLGISPFLRIPNCEFDSLVFGPVLLLRYSHSCYIRFQHCDNSIGNQIR